MKNLSALSVLPFTLSLFSAPAFAAAPPQAKNLSLGASAGIGVFGNGTYAAPTVFCLDSAAGAGPAAIATGTAGTTTWELRSHAIGRQVSESAPDVSIGGYCTVFPIDADEIDWNRTFQNIKASSAYRDGFVTVVDNEDDPLRRILFTRGGSVQVTFVDKRGAQTSKNYTVGGSTSSRPYRLYATRAEEGNTAAYIDLSGKYVRFFGDPQLITPRYSEPNGGVSNVVWGLDYDARNTHLLTARYIMINEAAHQYDCPQGQFVLAYYKTELKEELVSAIVVEIVPPSVNTLQAKVGDELRPIGGGYDIAGLKATVNNGAKPDSNDAYAPYLEVFSANSGEELSNVNHGKVFAIAPTDRTTSEMKIDMPWKADIYWKSPDPMGTLWTFENDWYLISWPSDGAIKVVQSDDTRNPGLPWQIPTNYTVTVMKYRAPASLPVSVDGALQTVKIDGSGAFLLKLTTAQNERPYYIPAESRYRTSTDVCDLAAVQPWTVGKELVLRTGPEAGAVSGIAARMSELLPGYIYEKGSLGRNWNPRLYHSPLNATVVETRTADEKDPYEALESSIYAVNSSDRPIEVWWRGFVPQDLPEPITYPGLVQHYRISWDDVLAPGVLPEIALSSGKGSDDEFMTSFAGRSLAFTSAESSATLTKLMDVSGDTNAVAAATFDFQVFVPAGAAQPGRVATITANGADALTVSLWPGETDDTFVLAVEDPTDAASSNFVFACGAWQLVSVPIPGSFRRVSLGLGARSGASGAVGAAYGIVLDDISLSYGDRSIGFSFSDDDLWADPTDARYRYAFDASGEYALVAENCSFAEAGAPALSAWKFRAADGCPPAVYFQNDPLAVGYNPNEEHAFMTINGEDYVAWALRNDLNVVTSNGFTSPPCVLVEYAKDGKGAMQAFRVVTVNAAHPELSRTVEAGKLMLPPDPIGKVSGCCTENDSSYSIISADDSALVYKDRKNQMWARRGDAMAHALYSYQLEAGFWCPPSAGALPVGTVVGWMNCVSNANPTAAELKDGTKSLPWLWSSTWPNPDTKPTMRIAQTLTVAENGLPEVWNAASMAVVYPNPKEDSSKVVEMIDPTVAQSSALAITTGDFPGEYGFTVGPSGTCTLRKGKYYFRNCPPSVSDRFYVDVNADESKRMNLIGDRVVKEAGGSYLRLNVLTREEREKLVALCTTTDPGAKARWDAAVNKLAVGEVVPVTRGNKTPATKTAETPFTFVLPRNQKGDEYVSTLLGHFTNGYEVVKMGKVSIVSTNDAKAAGANLAHYVSHSVSYLSLPTDQPKYKELKSEFEDNIASNLCYEGAKPGEKKMSWKVDTYHLGGVEFARDLCVLTVNMRIVTENSQPTLAYGAKDHLALVATGDGSGWVTLIENDNPDPTQVSPGLPVQMQLIRVLPELHADGIAVIPDPLNKLSEQLTLLYRTPLGDAAENFEFEWRRARPYADGTIEANKDLNPPWRGYEGIQAGRYSILLGANGASPDDYVNTYYALRIRPKEGTAAFRTISEARGTLDPNQLWSAWSPEQLAEGWLQRVLNAITPFAQRVEDFYSNPSDISYTMMEQIGKPYTGDVALNNDNLTEVGLLELYQTLFNRAEMLLSSMDGADADLSKQLILAMTRMGEFYTLLGAEAYADAKNPLIQCADGESYPSGTFSFANQVPTLLDEELALLRGRAALPALPRVTEAPLYNRLAWNLTKGLTEGEAAYVNNYGIRARNGVLDVNCAAAQYPQGHGDAWGHYLSALTGYYRLLRNPKFAWTAAMGEMLMDQKLVNVDYQDEQKFADAAVKLVQTGLDTFDLSWRKSYADGGDGYFDANSEQAFGCGEWATRTGLAAAYGWMTANALLPTNNAPYQAFTDRGIMKIDRTTATQLPVLCQLAQEVGSRLAAYDAGMNPLGLSENAIPFDIDPDQLAAKNSHFEQILVRAERALANCRTVLDYAGVYGARLRQLQNDETEAIDAKAKTELTYENQLIAIYGTPFAGDIGPGGTYPQGYEGPDLYNYNYMDLSVYGLEGLDTTFTNTFKLYYAPNNGTLGRADEKQEIATINYTVTAGGIRVKPATVTGVRATEGSIQSAYRSYILAYQALQEAIGAYDIAKTAMDNAAADTKEAISKSVIISSVGIANAILDALTDKSAEIDEARDSLMYMCLARISEKQQLPGLAAAGVVALIDGRSAVSAVADAEASGTMFPLLVDLTALYASQKSTVINKGFWLIAKTALETSWEWSSTIRDLGKAFVGAVEAVNTAAQAVQSKVAALSAAEAAYRAEVHKGELIQSERELWRQQLSNGATASRYLDMYSRVQRNLALTKYSTAFDTAQRYVWELAKVYDYETGLLSADPQSGKKFLADIIATRSLGAEGVSISSATTDGGLYDVVNRLKANWDVLKPRLGINNPDKPAKWFSLRRELFRIKEGAEGDAAWRKELAKYRVDNILADAAFVRHCQPPASASAVVFREPGYIIPFATSINDAENFFGKTLQFGDHQFSSADYATKIDAVGVDLVGLGELPGGADVEPNIYLVPVGLDYMRSPAGTERQLLSWNVVDQVLPLPYAVGSTQLDDQNWISTFSGLDGTSDSTATIRRHSTLRAGADFKSTRLVGRSAWNDRWIIVIPASAIDADREKAMNLIESGVKDVRLGIRAYARQGN